MMMRAIVAAALLVLSSAQAGQVTVPFTSCASPFQGKSAPAPKRHSVEVDLPEKLARRLAFYSSGSDVMIGPRGWYCAATIEMAGMGLYLSPRPIRPAEMVVSVRKVSGPFIEKWTADGGTRGRLQVVRQIKRFFPKSNIYADQVIEAGGVRARFPFGPFPGDREIRRSARLAEYLTPPGATGLGTDAHMRPGSEPIRSLVLLLPGDPLSSLVISVRLPKDQVDLAPVILSWAERQYAGPAAFSP